MENLKSSTVFVRINILPAASTKQLNYLYSILEWCILAQTSCQQRKGHKYQTGFYSINYSRNASGSVKLHSSTRMVWTSALVHHDNRYMQIMFTLFRIIVQLVGICKLALKFLKSQSISKIIRTNPKGTIIACPKFHGNPPHSSVGTQA